ncbi:MAG: polysaccharide deacetylase, partial [Ruminococcus sp.]|nr:polysaccharide deacetylase [Ruminococcus sp.]
MEEIDMDWCRNYKKAITFSYDDGVEQDVKLLEILNEYGLKATFNLNTGLNYDHGTWKYG